jgi:hypothetical protein
MKKTSFSAIYGGCSTAIFDYQRVCVLPPYVAFHETAGRIAVRGRGLRSKELQGSGPRWAMPHDALRLASDTLMVLNWAWGDEHILNILNIQISIGTSKQFQRCAVYINIDMF